MDSDIFAFLSIQKIHFHGYNLSFIVDPENPSGYLATIRRKQNLYYNNDEAYPSVSNQVFLVSLDSSFQIIDSSELREKPDLRIPCVSYTTGLEDCRLIDNGFMTGVLLDSSDKWIPEVCLCQFDRKTSTIHKIMSLCEYERVPQKNWLVLSSTSTLLYMLHSYDPMKIISVEKETGNISIVHYQKILNLEDCEVHGGASVYLPESKQHLISARIVYNHDYESSLWILLNERYKLCGVSEPFRFMKSEPDANGFYYEMCMSLVEKKESVLASVSINDKDIYIIEYNKKFILESIFNSEH